MDENQLIANLYSKNPEIKLNSAKELSSKAKENNLNAKFLPKLLTFLKDHDKNVRLAMSETIGWMAHNNTIKDKSMLTPAIELLTSDPPMLRHDGAWILESLAKEDITDLICIEPLLNNLLHKNFHVKAATAYCLGTFAKIGIKNDRIYTELLKLEDINDKDVQRAYKTAIANYNIE